MTSVSGTMYGSKTLVYNDDSRLTSMTYGGVTDLYYYKYTGERYRARLSGTYYRYLYNGERVLEELNDSGTMQARYTTESGSYYDTWLHFYRTSGTLSRFPMYDNIGSARGLLDASGTATDWYELDTFGRQVSSSGTTPNPYRFGAAWGYITDPSGMLQLGHRFYWPEVGRFVSRDPTRSASSSYAYASNRPTVGVDADGRWWWLVGIAVCLVSGCAEQAIHMSADMTDQMEALKRCAQAPNPDPANPWMAWPVPGMPEWECWHEPYVDECAYEQLHQIWVAHQEGNGWGPWQAAPRNQNGQPWGQWGD